MGCQLSRISQLEWSRFWGTGHTYYHCTGKRAGCTQKSLYIKEDELYNQLLELLDSYELAPEMYDWAMNSFRDFVKQEAQERDQL